MPGSRWLRPLLWLAGVLLALGALVTFAGPPLLKSQIEKRGTELLGRELHIGELKLSPFMLAVTLRELSIGGAPGDTNAQPQLQIARLFVDLDMRSLLRLAPVVEALEIDAPHLRLARLAEGRYDIDDLLRRFVTEAPPPTGEPARFALFNLRLRDGEFNFDDKPMARSHAMRRLTLDLPFLSNLPADVQVKVEPRLAFTLNGSEFESQGRSTPFAEGRASEFKVHFDKLDLSPWWAYLPKGLPAQPVGGWLWTDLTLRFEQHQQSGAHVELQGSTELRDLALRAAAGEPLLEWQSLRVRLADVRPLERQVGLESVHLDGARLHVQRDASGHLNLEKLAPQGSSKAEPAKPPASADASPWRLQLARFELGGAQLLWQDASVQPSAKFEVDAIDLQLQGLRWPVESDAALRLSARLLANTAQVGQVQAQGTLSDQHAKVALALSNLQLAAAAPYLHQTLRPQLSASLNATGELDWARGDAPRLAILLSKLRVDEFKLADAAPATPRRGATSGKPLALVPVLELSEARVDMLQRRVELGSLSVQRPFVELARDAAGRLNASTWLNAEPAATTPKVPADAQAAPPWQVALREFKLDGGRVRYSDAALPSSPLELNALRAQAQGLRWPLAPGAAPLQTQLSARLVQVGAPRNTAAATPALLDWRGQVWLPPSPGARGKLNVERFPVHVFEPLFGAELPVSLQRVEAGFRGEIDLKQLPAGLSGKARGDALLADLRIVAKDAPSAAGPPAAGRAAEAAGIAASAPARELLTWNALALNKFSVALAPGVKPRVEIEEVRLSDYYSRLEITEDGRFNLQTVAAKPGSAAAGGAAPAVAPAAPASAASSAGVSAPVAMLSKLPVDLVIGGAQFSNGRVDFTDHFIRPNYSAALSELNGSLGRFASDTRDMATLKMSGRVAGTGQLELGGALNPAASPPALDITAKASDIELPGLTPYSIKYAGYPIERGKLSMDVAYKVDDDGKLDASNRIIVNQLTFGERVDSPTATKLPVRLAVALLQDANGVIDLDLPVTGSINDPHFNLGALIWKVIVNLFTKAATSPFSVLSGSAGKDLSTVEFRPGTAQITAASQEVVDKVAKALADRPGLRLSVTGMADPALERQAMQSAALEARLVDEQRRELARGSLGNSAPEAPPPPLSAEQRARLLKQLYTDTALPGKPRNLIGMAKDLPPAEMQAMLEAAVPVDDTAARRLAVQRAGAVREALVAKGLGSERLFMGEPKLHTASAENAAWVPQAQLALSVN